MSVINLTNFYKKKKYQLNSFNLLLIKSEKRWPVELMVVFFTHSSLIKFFLMLYTDPSQTYDTEIKYVVCIFLDVFIKYIPTKVEIYIHILVIIDSLFFDVK